MTLKHFWTAKWFVALTIILALVLPIVVVASTQAADRRLPEHLGIEKVVASIDDDPIAHPTYRPIIVEEHQLKAPVVKHSPRPRASSYVKPSLEKIRQCIVHRESRGIATIRRTDGGTASGLYGFIDKTWNNFRGYKSAWMAPAKVQTERFYAAWKYWQTRYHSKPIMNPWYGDLRHCR